MQTPFAARGMPLGQKMTRSTGLIRADREGRGHRYRLPVRAPDAANCVINVALGTADGLDLI